MHNGDETLPVNEDRRSFLGTAAVLIGAGIGGVMGFTLYGYAVGQALKTSSGEQGGNWLDIGRLDEFEEGKPTKKSVTVSTLDGWIKSRTEEALWIVRRGEAVTVFTATCPHLGCKVQWTEAEASFFCPCHASAFGRDGNLVKGASARGLDTLPVRTQADGGLQVDFKRFKALIGEKIELV